MRANYQSETVVRSRLALLFRWMVQVSYRRTSTDEAMEIFLFWSLKM
jgi:hypothetical protein